MSSSNHQTTQNNEKTNSTTSAPPEQKIEGAPVAESRAPGTILPQAMANPASIAPDDVRQLQRAGGNRAVSQLLSGSPATPVQAKLTLGPVNDKYEQEADSVAKRVVDTPVQRQEEEEEEAVQAKPAGGMIQRIQRMVAGLAQRKPAINERQPGRGTYTLPAVQSASNSVIQTNRQPRNRAAQGPTEEELEAARQAEEERERKQAKKAKRKKRNQYARTALTPTNKASRKAHKMLDLEFKKLRWARKQIKRRSPTSTYKVGSIRIRPRQIIDSILESTSREGLLEGTRGTLANYLKSEVAIAMPRVAARVKKLRREAKPLDGKLAVVEAEYEAWNQERGPH